MVSYRTEVRKYRNVTWRQETRRRFPEPGRDEGHIVDFLVGMGEIIGQRCNTEYFFINEKYES